MRWKPACLRPAVAAERALSSAAVATESSLHLLFVVFDAGESNLLKPVVEAIATLKLWSVGVLVLGEPATTIFKDSPCMRSLDSLGVKTKALNGKEDPSRTQRLSESDLELVCAGLGPVEVVVSGMAYAMQAQVAGAWSASPTPPCAVVGVVDNWAKWSEASFSGRALRDSRRHQRNPRSVAAADERHTRGAPGGSGGRRWPPEHDAVAACCGQRRAGSAHWARAVR